MTRFVLESWDKSRLVVNHSFANLLRRHHLTTFDVIWGRTAEAAVAKKLRDDRFTLRFTIDDAGHERAFYIKRHARSSWKEYIKPLFSLRWPILGAKNEWNALLEFHEAGLPTMTPVAFGQHDSNSFLITEALEDCTKLSELRWDPADDSVPRPQFTIHRNGTIPDRRRLIERVADVARRMHGAGLHHQDFYLGHLLLPNHRATKTPGTSATPNRPGDERIYVIDLGRVQKQVPLSSRWIVKDLAQLNHSAQGVTSTTDRLRFLREYLGRKIGPADRPLIARIAAKTARISRHSKKNSL
jgi:heptose I phosphotransferase